MPYLIAVIIVFIQKLFPFCVSGIVRQIVADAPGLVVVFDHIGEKSHSLGPLLALKAAALIGIRIRPFAGVPSKWRFAHHRLAKIKEG